MGIQPYGLHWTLPHMSVCLVARLLLQLMLTMITDMVLFYCSFVVMKRQDRAGVPHPDLLEHYNQLSNDGVRDSGIEFEGTILDGRMEQTLRIITDRSSGAVRLEACGQSWPMKDVPIWTTFITKYKSDPDWVELDREGKVSLAALRPGPYVFMSGYQPLQKRGSEHILQFATQRGKSSFSSSISKLTLVAEARNFVEEWTRICRSERGYARRYDDGVDSYYR